MFCYWKLKHRVRPRHAVTFSTPHAPSPKHRPVKLTLVTESKEQTTTAPRALTTTRETVPSFKLSGSQPPVNNAESAGRSKYKRLKSHDVRRGSSTPSQPHTLTLSYDRSRMKRPSVANATPTPDAPTQRDLSEPYVPHITVAPSNWSAWLARNYYNLNSFKFLLTFLINIILLTFKVPHPL